MPTYGLYQHNNDYGGAGDVKLRDIDRRRITTNPSQFDLPDDNVTDGEAREFNVTMGVSTEDGRGNITAYAGVRDNKPVLQRDRDYSACSLDPNPTDHFTCGGSATSYPGYFTGSARRSRSTQTDRQHVPAVQFATRTVYNFGPVEYYQRPDTRYTLGAMGHYELAEVADVYTQLMFSDYESVAQIAPGGNFFDTGTDQLRQSVAVGTAARHRSVATRLWTRMRTTPGNQAVVPMYVGAPQHRRWRTSVEVREQLVPRSARCSWPDLRELGLRHLGSVLAQSSREPVGQQLFPQDPPGARQRRHHGSGHRQSGLPFGARWHGPELHSVQPLVTIGGVTPEALAYVQVPGLQQGKIEQEIYTASVTGDLGAYGIKSPFATESIKIAAGIEKRFDRLTNVTDDPSSQNLLSGAGGATIGISGSTKVLDLFTEVRLPLVQDMAFADQLGMELALSPVRLRSGHDRYVQDRHGLGAGAGRAFPRELSACDSCGERGRAVHLAGLQPVRSDG